MVVSSLPGNDNLKGGVFGGVPDVIADVPQNPVLPRRASARVKKIQAEKALRGSLEEDEPETKVVQKRIPRPPPKRRPKTLPVDAGEGGSEGDSPDSEDVADENAKSSEEYTSGVVNVLVGLQNRTYKSFLEKVKVTLRAFNKLYLHFTQEEEKRVGPNKAKRSQASKNKENVQNKDVQNKENAPKDDQNEDAKGLEVSKKRKRGDDEKIRQKRPDLKAMSKIIQTNAVLHPKKLVGAFPGIEPGYQFLSRAEMVVVGFHQHQISGIDYIGKTATKGSYDTQDFAGCNLPLATSIVVSGQYEDDLDKSEDLVYTGQGGNDLLGSKHQVKTQLMERGNLALKHSIEAGTPVRVVRGHDSHDSYAGKVYTYDGLYKVLSYDEETGKSGYPVYKFKLKRLEGQPPLTTSQVYFTRGRNSTSTYELPGLVCKDISGGLEKIPIPATNVVDDAVLPAGFTYRTRMKVAENVKLPANASGCECKEVCNPKKCACARLNGSSDFPYVHINGGRLIEPKAVVFECGPHCGCKPECVNRTSQKGLRYRLEVFRTANKGWGVRSWDYIPMGAPICEYLGVVMKTDDVKAGCDDTYIFDIDCLQTMQGLDGRESRLKDVALPSSYLVKNDDNSAPEYCIDGFTSGNVTRFINHSCSPNLFVQCVLSSHHDVNLARIVLFAADNIRPFKELSYDYGYTIGSVLNPDGTTRVMNCHCGVPDCRKRLL